MGIGAGIGVRIANAGLRREMQYHVIAVVSRRSTQGFRLGDVDLDEAIGRARADLRKSPLLQSRVVVRIDVVHRGDRVAGVQQCQCRVIADKTGSTSDQRSEEHTSELQSPYVISY